MLFKISILDKEWCYEKFQTMKHEKHMKKGELASTIDLKIDQIKAELEKQKIVYIAIYPVHHFIVFKEEKSDIVDIYQSFKKSYNLESDVKINPQTANWKKILNHFGDGSSLDDYILDALKSLSDSNWSNMLVIVVNFEIEDLVLYASVKAEVKSANYSIIKHLNSGISLTEGTSLEKAILYSMNELGLVRLLNK